MTPCLGGGILEGRKLMSCAARNPTLPLLLLVAKLMTVGPNGGPLGMIVTGLATRLALTKDQLHPVRPTRYLPTVGPEDAPPFMATKLQVPPAVLVHTK
jgi:hypothetical protein